jgi:hypothetical protein
MDQPQDRRRCYYRCPDCGSEWTWTFPKGERKLRSWCKTCKHFVTPYQVTNTKTSQVEARVIKPKSAW